MRAAFIYAVLLALLTSCNTPRHLARICAKCTTHTQDSTVLKSYTSDSFTLETRLRIDTIHIPGDTVQVEIPIVANCDSLGQVRFIPGHTVNKGYRAGVSVEVTDRGTIKVNSECKGLLMYTFSQDSIIKQLRATTDSLSHRQTVTVTKHVILPLKWWQHFLAVSGAIFYALLCLYFGWKLGKFFIKRYANSIGIPL